MSRCWIFALVKDCMTQDEMWLSKWQAAMDFIETERRNPSKFVDEERGIRNWVKHNRKLMNAEMLKAERMEKFNMLLALSETYRHKNQYE